MYIIYEHERDRGTLWQRFQNGDEFIARFWKDQWFYLGWHFDRLGAGITTVFAVSNDEAVQQFLEKETSYNTAVEVAKIIL